MWLDHNHPQYHRGLGLGLAWIRRNRLSRLYISKHVKTHSANGQDAMALLLESSSCLETVPFGGIDPDLGRLQGTERTPTVYTSPFNHNPHIKLRQSSPMQTTPAPHTTDHQDADTIITTYQPCRQPTSTAPHPLVKISRRLHSPISPRFLHTRASVHPGIAETIRAPPSDGPSIASPDRAS